MLKVLKGVSAISKIAEFISGLLIFMMVLLVFAAVVARYVFKHPFTITEEITGYVIVFAVFMGTGYAMRAGTHIRTTILIDKLSPKNIKLFYRMGLFVSFVWGVIMLMATKALIEKYLISGTTSVSTLQTPLWIPALFMGIGSLILCIDIIAKFIESFLDIDPIDPSTNDMNDYYG